MLKDYEKTHIATATTTQVVVGPCKLNYITINTTAAGTIKVIDGTGGTTANVATLVASAPVGTYRFDCVMATGIRIVTAASSDITVCWNI